MNIHAGDKVKTRIPPHKKWVSKEGVVIGVVQHDPLNPVEGHGCVTVLFEDGMVEHYTHTRWSEFLKHVENKS